MLPFLKLFGSEDGNGVSPFAVNIGTPYTRVSEKVRCCGIQ